MLPLIKRSTDNLVAVMKERAESEKGFDVFKYVKFLNSGTGMQYLFDCAVTLFSRKLWEIEPNPAPVLALAIYS